MQIWSESLILQRKWMPPSRSCCQRTGQQQGMRTKPSPPSLLVDISGQPPPPTMSNSGISDTSCCTSCCLLDVRLASSSLVNCGSTLTLLLQVGPLLKRFPPSARPQERSPWARLFGNKLIGRKQQHPFLDADQVHLIHTCHQLQETAV